MTVLGVNALVFKPDEWSAFGCFAQTASHIRHNEYLSVYPMAMTDGVEPLLVRARMMCEDGLFAKAHELVDKALNIDPRNADAYIVSLMAHHQAVNEAELGAIPTDRLATHPDYVKAMRFGDVELRRRLEVYAARACELASFEEATHLLRLSGAAQDRPLTESWQSSLENHAKKRMEEDRREAEATARENARKAREKDLRTRAEEILDVDYHPDGVRWKITYVHPSEDRVLVLSSHLIAQRCWKGTTWRDSELRAWLNSEFLESMPPRLRARIVAVDHRTGGETDSVMDSVFVPSEGELIGSRHTTYLDAGKDEPSGYVWSRQWWVRDSGSAPGRAAAMHRNGHPVFTLGRERRYDFEEIYGVPTYVDLGVRPSFWLSVGDPKAIGRRHESPLVTAARRLCEEGKFRKEVTERHAGSRMNTDVAEGAAAVALALDPNDVGAHIVALMADYLCPTEGDLGLLATAEMSNNSHYLRALRLGDKDLRLRLEGYDISARKRASIVANIEKLVHDTAATAEAEKALHKHQTQTKLLSAKCENLSSELAELERQIQEAVKRHEDLGLFALRKRYEAASERDRLTEEHLTVCSEFKATEHELSAYKRQLAEMTDEWRSRRLIDSFQVREIDDSSGRALVVATKPAASKPYGDNADSLWTNRTVRSWLNTHFRESLPERIRSRLRPLVHEDGTIDHVFILSEAEATTRSSIDSAPLAALNSAGWAPSTSTDESPSAIRLNHTGMSLTFNPDPTAFVYPAMLVSFGSES